MAFNTTDITFDTGHHGVVFDSSAVNGTEQIKAKDSTKQNFYIEFIELMCGSGASAAIFDGSSGNQITPTVACASQTTLNYVYNLPDPIVCDGTTSLCISGAADGFVSGMVKYYKGLNG